MPRRSGRDVSSMLFYYVCGLFKVAVIAQQIYARYVRGVTQDQRFARFDQLVAALGLAPCGRSTRGASAVPADVQLPFERVSCIARST